MIWLVNLASLHHDEQITVLRILGGDRGKHGLIDRPQDALVIVVEQVASIERIEGPDAMTFDCPPPSATARPPAYLSRSRVGSRPEVDRVTLMLTKQMIRVACRKAPISQSE